MGALGRVRKSLTLAQDALTRAIVAFGADRSMTTLLKQVSHRVPKTASMRVKLADPYTLLGVWFGAGSRKSGLRIDMDNSTYWAGAC